jgi:hypothetical protein
MTSDTLRPALEREHRQWIEEVMAALDPAQRPDAGVWARWEALRYLQTTFASRLDRERRMVEGVMPALNDVQRETLWALGELLDALRQQLDHLIGLCQRAEQFSTVTGRIVTALRHWCRAVEDGVGPLSAAAMPPQSRDALAELAPDAVMSGT